MRLARSVWVVLLASMAAYACGSSKERRSPTRDGYDGGDAMAPTDTGGTPSTGGRQGEPDAGTGGSGGTVPASGGRSGEGGALPDASIDASAEGSTPGEPDAPPLGEFCVFADPKTEYLVRSELNRIAEQIDGGVPEGPISIRVASRLTSIDMFCDCSDVYDFAGAECLIGLETLALAGEYLNLDRLRWLPALATVTFRYTSELPEGLEALKQIRTLDISHINTVTDLSPIAALTSLTELAIPGNGLTDLGPLASLTRLKKLMAYGNQISDLTPLSGLTNLEELNIGNNLVTSLAPLSALTKLVSLEAGGNAFTNLAPLQGLTSLSYLGIMSTEHVTNLGPLVANAGLGAGDEISFSLFESDCASYEADADALSARGVVLSNPTVCP
jgi:internalin A